MKIKILTRTQMGEMLLISGTCLFIGGMIGFMTSDISQEFISVIGALALIIVGAGTKMKK